MKSKLNMLILSIATITLVLGLALGHSRTVVTTEAHELTVSEMQAITGTGVCKSSQETQESGSDTCSGSHIECSTDDACGSDWTKVYKHATCTGSTITSGPACSTVDSENPKKTKYTCYCKDNWWPIADKCSSKSKDIGIAKKYKADIYHDCGASTSS